MHAATHDTITATELARNLSAVIDRVRLNRRALSVTKGSQTVAELGPPPKAGYPIARLGEMLASLPGLGNGAADMLEDQQHIRRLAALPENPWGS